MRKITTDSLNWFWEKGVKPIKEKVENIKNVIDTTVKIAEIVNNCVTDNPDLPLSAAQGKFLMDQITGLNSDMENTFATLANGVLNSKGYVGDVKNITRTGIYSVGSPSVGNTPEYGLLLHIQSADYKAQLLIGNTGKIYTRYASSLSAIFSTWTTV